MHAGHTQGYADVGADISKALVNGGSSKVVNITSTITRWPLPTKSDDSSGVDRAGSIDASNQIEVCESNQDLMLQQTNANFGLVRTRACCRCKK